MDKEQRYKQLEALFKATVLMREAQKNFFAKRSDNWLEESKIKERQVDQLIQGLSGQLNIL